MFTIKSIHHTFSVLLLTVSVLALAPAQAQLKALLPTATIDAQQAYLKASNSGAWDRFGRAVAVDGDTLVVAAYAEDSAASGVNGNQADNSANASGAVYVFVRSGGSWSQQAYLKASNSGAGDLFGRAIALSGDTLVVGAPVEDSGADGVNGNGADNSAADSGAAYVFTRSAGLWSQQAYLKASNSGAGDTFGRSVALSGDTLVVGADEEDGSASGVNGNQADNSANASGAAYVFTRSAGVWSQQAYLKASNTGVGDTFGESVALSGDTLVVGAPGEDSHAGGVNGDQGGNAASDSGAAYVFTRSAGLWSQQAYLKASNTGAGDGFGAGVALSSDTLVVGAPYEDSAATGVNGDQNSNAVSDSGAAYVFTRSAGLWSQQAYLKASNTGAGADFGHSVAISAETLVVGAPYEDSAATGVNGDQGSNAAADDSGAAYGFTRSGSAWGQQAYLKASNTGAGDEFGYSVTVSGETLVVGAFFEDSAATGVNGNQADNSAGYSGAAYVLVLPPLVTASLRAGASPTTAASVDFTISLSEAVTGVDVSDFALTGSNGITGAAVTGVSGGPTVYTVTVDSGSGSGSLRLDVVDDDTIQDAGLNPLGGVGTGNGDFSTGQAYVVRPVTQTFASLPTQDGWVLETGESSGVGGTLDSAATAFQLGDDALNKQYRAILHFNTGSVPDTAVITKATLKIKKHSIVGTNPFSTHGGLRADLVKPFFGTAAALQAADFQATATSSAVGTFGATPVSNWYSAMLNAAGKTNINRSGATQFRLRFATDDNNDLGADFMKFFSGNFATAADRPTLVIEYYVP